MKTCTRCKIQQPIEEFHLDRGKSVAQCKQCKYLYNKEYKRKNWPRILGRRRSPEREYLLKSKYGLSLEQYTTMLKNQNGVCAICNKPESYKDRSGNIGLLCVDHCHLSGQVRSLLCRRCNMAIGQFTDDPVVIQRAVNYLERYRR
jgi:hypothetical protein